MELGLSARQRARLEGEYPAELAGTAPQAGVLAALGAAYSEGYTVTWARELAAYKTYCSRVGQAAFPVTVWPLMMFLADRVLRRKLEPGGLGITRSVLHTAVRKSKLGWELTDDETALVLQLQRGLTKQFKGQNARGQKDPCTLRHLQAMRQQLHLVGAQERQDLLQMGVAHGGFLRTGEHADGKLKVGDVLFLTQDNLEGESLDSSRVRFAVRRDQVVGVRLRLIMAKTGHLEVPPQEALIGRRTDDLDVVLPLFDWMASHGLLQGGHEEEPLWTRLDVSGSRTSAPRSGAEFRSSLAGWMVRIGSPAGNWGGHSLRRGACNDALDGGVPIEVVMKAGRWRSSAVFTYRRLTAAAMRAVAAVAPQAGLAQVSPASKLYFALKEGCKGG